MGYTEAQRLALLEQVFGKGQVPPRLAGEFLSTAEVAALFQVSERTIAVWARNGYLPSMRSPGGYYVFSADEIRDYLARAAEGVWNPDQPAI